MVYKSSASFFEPFLRTSGTRDIFPVVTPFLCGPGTFYLFKELLKWHKQELEWRWQSHWWANWTGGLLAWLTGSAKVLSGQEQWWGRGGYWRGPAGAAVAAF